MRFSLGQFGGTVASGTAASNAIITAIAATAAGAAAVAAGGSAASTDFAATGGAVAVAGAVSRAITLAPPERSPVRLFRLGRLTGGGVDVVSCSARADSRQSRRGRHRHP